MIPIRIAVFGGSFDPVHSAHVALASDAQKLLSVDQLRILPAKCPPHKEGFRADECDRVRMLELAFARQPNCVIDLRELAAERTSYTVLSMQSLREELGQDASICFILGWDSFSALDTWWRWRDLFELVNLVVAGRPGFAGFRSESVKREFEARFEKLENLATHTSGKISSLPTKAMNISSTAIRSALAEKTSRGSEHNTVNISNLVNGAWPELDNVTKMLPVEVAQYINQHGLYR